MAKHSRWAKGIIAAAKTHAKKKRKAKVARKGRAHRKAHHTAKPHGKHRAKPRAHKPKRPVKVKGSRQGILFAGSCGCNRRCCSAAGVRCACRCHGRNHGGVKHNPPRSTSREPKLHVHRFSGAPTSLRYRRGGQTYEHAIGPGASILVPHRGDYIIVKGVRTGEYLEG